MAEGNGLLNRRRGKTSTEGSNPSLSATVVNRSGYPESARVGTGRRDLVALAPCVVGCTRPAHRSASVTSAAPAGRASLATPSRRHPRHERLLDPLRIREATWVKRSRSSSCPIKAFLAVSFLRKSSRIAVVAPSLPAATTKWRIRASTKDSYRSMASRWSGNFVYPARISTRACCTASGISRSSKRGVETVEQRLVQRGLRNGQFFLRDRYHVPMAYWLRVST